MSSLLSQTAFPKLNAIGRSFLYWLLFLLFLFITGAFITHQFPDSWERFIYGSFGTAAALAVTWFVLKLEKSSFGSIGLVWERKTGMRFLYGLVIGALLFALIIIPLFAFSNLTIEWNPKPITVLEALFYLSIIPLALMEEIAFRSYPFVKLNRALGFLPTQLIVSVMFAMYHVFGGWSFTSAFMGPAIWSLIFGLATYKSGGIAIATGIHVALNVAQPMLGMRTGTYHPLWILSIKGGETEASLARIDMLGTVSQMIVLIIGVGLTLYYLRKGNSQ